MMDLNYVAPFLPFLSLFSSTNTFIAVKLK